MKRIQYILLICLTLVGFRTSAQLVVEGETFYDGQSTICDDAGVELGNPDDRTKVALDGQVDVSSANYVLIKDGFAVGNFNEDGYLDVRHSNLLTLDLVDEIEIIKGQQVILPLKKCGGSGTVSFLWSNSGSLDAHNIANPVASPTSTTSYNVTVTDDNGTAIEDVVVKVKELKPYSGVRKKLDASYVLITDDVLRFSYKEEYNRGDDAELEYIVYDDLHNSQSGIAVEDASVKYGNNQYEMDVATLPNGFYLLEIVNSKQEILYARFKINRTQ